MGIMFGIGMNGNHVWDCEKKSRLSKDESYFMPGIETVNASCDTHLTLLP